VLQQRLIARLKHTVEIEKTDLLNVLFVLASIISTNITLNNKIVDGIKNNYMKLDKRFSEEENEI
jgi:hypothetical protein